MSIEMWFSLLLTSLMISISPGAGAVTTMNQSVHYGFRKSLYTVTGLQIGWAIQIIVVSIGVGTILTSNSLLLSVFKWIGVIYLLILGWQQFRDSFDQEEFGKSGENSTFNGKSSLIKAIFINLTNIKATLFLVLFIPIFINPESPSFDQFFLLLATMVFADIVVMTGYSGMSYYLKKLIRNNKIHYIKKASGIMLIIIAISIAISESAA